MELQYLISFLQQVAVQYQGHYRLIFGESDAGYQPSEEAKQAGEKAFIHLTKIIGKLLPDNTSAEQKQEVALQIWSLVHGYVSLKQHAIADVIDVNRWEGFILDAVDLHVDAIIKRYNAV